jgi:transcriptional regulator with XRE-family HTH domain
LFICHDCDNPPCCNPHHLFLGTTQDNTADRDRKGRQVCGSAHYETILTEDDVVVIRVLKKSGWIGREIAEEFGVSPSTIYKICSGKTWSHADRD